MEKSEEETNLTMCAGYQSALVDMALYLRDLRSTKSVASFMPDERLFRENEGVKKDIEFFHIELGKFLEWISQSKEKP